MVLDLRVRRFYHQLAHRLGAEQFLARVSDFRLGAQDQVYDALDFIDVVKYYL